MRILVSSSLRLAVLDKIHRGHQDIVKRMSQAKGSVWWPGLSREIQDMVQGCQVSLQHKVSSVQRRSRKSGADCQEYSEEREGNRKRIVGMQENRSKKRLLTS